MSDFGVASPPARASPAPTWIRLWQKVQCSTRPLRGASSALLRSAFTLWWRCVANTARILVQDVSDVFRVIEHRGFDKPDAA